MNFVQQLEECLRDLAAEARKKHPGVKEASERATLKLRTLKNEYVSAVRKASARQQQQKDGASEEPQAQHPTTRLFQSSDLLHPFLLAANYPNATNNLLEISFRAMKLLMEADAVVPSDGLNLVRVWTIQAQVVTAYYQKMYGKELSFSNKKMMDEDNDSTESTVASNSGGGWFSWGGPSTFSSASSAAATSNTWESSSNTLTTKNAVSSSSGQTGQGSQSPATIERLAIEILSCLLQLLELLKNYPDSLTQRELWTNSVALASLWLYKVPARHKVRVAAETTTIQVLTLLYQHQSSQDPFVTATWEDLLSLASHKKSTSKKLTGAFSQKVANHPQPEFALQLMAQVWKNAHFRPDDRLFLETLSLTIGSFGTNSVQIYPWSYAVFSARAVAYPNECRELFMHMIKPIAAATDACRRHDDFEDGFIYTGEEKHDRGSLASFFPNAVLWKAGFALEVVFLILDKESPERDVLLQDTRIVASLAEALSHFATIGASCRDHMLQLMDFLAETAAVNLHKPTILRKADQTVGSGNSAAIFSSKTEGKSESPILGECLWISFQGILRIAHSLADLQQPSNLLEETFAPFLAILQHYMKRFVGSHELVEIALRGYSILADVCLPLQDCPMQRKALLTSLCKLSLPSWGKHDPSCQLQDHHVRSLLCLLKIVHMHHGDIDSEWDLILWTMEELSLLNIASPLLSDEAYHSAMAISALYSRLGSFSTCFSDRSVVSLSETLADICESAMSDRDIVGGTETVLMPGRPTASVPVESSDKGTDGRSISGKIVSMGAMGVKAIYGTYAGDNSNNPSEDGNGPEKLPTEEERPKHAFYEDYLQSFIEKMNSSSHTVRVSSMGRVPFAVLLLTDVVILNTFRSNECGQTITAQLSRLAASIPAARSYVMDILTLLIMSQLSGEDTPDHSGPSRVVFKNPMISQLLATERIIDGSSSSEPSSGSHADVFSQLCETIRNTKTADIGEAALSVVSMILQGAGHNIHGDLWVMIIKAVSSMSGDPAYEIDRSSPDWAECSLMGFRCLKLIVDDFIDELPPSTGEGLSVQDCLLDCCSSFVSAQHDINTSLTAIGVLWTIADRDSNSQSIDLTLKKLVQLSCDERAEVRNAAVNTLFSCIVGRGGTFAAEQWKLCFVDTIFGVYDNVALQLNSSVTKQPERSNRSAAKASRYQVNRHYSRDSASKQWVATQVLVLRGLTRVLRSFFQPLLDTADSGDSSPVPWFQDTWVKILDWAWEAANQDGDRESLNIRSAGVEILGMCCQLTSKAGIEVAVTPARVGTNMEVVNGALRSVRESTTRTTVARSYSTATDLVRKNLFLEAFESLESFQEVTTERKGQGDFPEDTDLQVFHKFCSSLAKLYECCKSDEFRVSGDPTITNGGDEAEEDLEKRFVSLVAAMLETSSKSDQTRFLNQAQRCSLDLLREIAAEGSSKAIYKLVEVAGAALFVGKDNEDGEIEVKDEPSSVADLLFLNHEAATVVSEAVSKGNMSDECLLFVFKKVLLTFKDSGLSDHTKDWRRRHFAKLVPIAIAALKSISELSSRCPQLKEDIDKTWSAFAQFLYCAFSPVQTDEEIANIPRASELHELLRVAVSSVPVDFVPQLRVAIDEGMASSFKGARQYAVLASQETDTETGRKAKKSRDDLVKFFEICFDSCCLLDPEAGSIRSVAIDALSGALSAKTSDPDKEFLDIVSLTICEVIQAREGMQMLVVSLFPLMTQLIVSEDERLKMSVCAVFRSVDVASIIQDAEFRYEQAKRRAEQAEQQVEALTAAVAELQRKAR